MEFLKRKLFNIKRSVCFFFQRRCQGFDDSEVWNLDCSFGEWIYPRFKRLREIQQGHPSQISQDKWEKILDEIEYAFSIIADEDKYFNLGDEDWDKVEKGMALFAEWFNCFWD